MNHLLRIAFILGLLISMPALAVVHMTPCPNRNIPGVPNDPPCQTGFPVAVTELGNDSVIYSTTTVADLDGDGVPEIIFGTMNGYVVALRANGDFYWKYKTGTVPIQSKPAVADITGNGSPEVVVGVGDASTMGGGVYVISNTGAFKCSFTALNTAHNQGMYSSPALGRLDPSRPNKMQIAVGSFDFRIRALNDDCSVYWVKGQAESVIDSVWSAPALIDLDRDGQLDVIIGQDSNLQTNNGYTTPDGGLMRGFRGNGSGELPGFPIQLDEVVYGSPAGGDILNNGQWSFAVGNGRCWDITSCASGHPHSVTKAIYTWGPTAALRPGWPVLTPGQSTRTASPALADLDGDGKLEVIINTMSSDDVTGNVHVLQTDGSERPGWPKQPDIPASCTPGSYLHYGTEASPIVADINGDGKLDIIVPAANEYVIWDRDGVQLTTKDGCPATPGKFSLYSGSNGFHSTAVAADLDGDGHIEIIGTGTNSSVPGFTGQYATIYAWTFPTSVASVDNMPWPAFRHDARNTGVYVTDHLLKDGFEP